ncbi:hypothetical protein Tco_0124193 [Tanacetum coccineum]
MYLVFDNLNVRRLVIDTYLLIRREMMMRLMKSMKKPQFMMKNSSERRSLCLEMCCDNLIAAEAVQKLGLKTENHLKPYKLQWLKKGPWEYDRDITHNWRTNTYSFLFWGVKITLMPNKPKEVVSKPTGKEVAEDTKIPEAMIPLLKEFLDVFPDE